MALQKFSESVYVALCLKIGTHQQVAIRRELSDILELFSSQMTGPGNLFLALSGSRREGFRFQDSDIDLMFWEEIPRVVWDYSQCQFYDTNKYKLIFSDSSESLPGFTLIFLTLDRVNSHIASTCVNINGAFCISSSRYRDKTCEFQTFRPHGPCTSGRIGSTDIDHAHCLVSDFWPPIACSWINRCNLWPAPHVVDQIVKSGCHVVAIGHKLSKHVENEWRISFSKAETKLVYSMNHTQFLTYGLLKLFLKEILNIGLDEDEKLLCSYHVKTAILWAIQQNAILDWCPQNLLECFWVCFKLLLKWIYEGVCPNFFIPENNMFIHKMHHGAQYTLFNKLYDLYEKGIMVVLECPSIGSYMMDNLYSLVFNPNLSLRTNHMLISEAAFDEGLFGEILKNDVLGHPEDKLRPTEYIKKVEKLLRVHLSKYQVLMLQRLTVSALHTTVFYLKSQCTDTLSGNRKMYIFDKLYCNMLKIAAKFGVISDMLFIAMHFYATCRYTKAISVLSATKVKLRKPGLIYYRNWDPESYTEAVGGQSWSTKMREAVASDVVLYSHIFYIPELTLEQEYSYKLKRETLCIPPFILLHMLEFLCYQHVDANKAFTALIDLQDVVFKDDRIPYFLKDISWNIFGTCEQIYGNQFAALFCYIQSCLEVKQNRIHLASVKRMIDMRLYCH